MSANGPDVSKAASAQGGSFGTVTRQGCVILIPVTTTAPGAYRVEAWDDGTFFETFDWVDTEPGEKILSWQIPGVADSKSSGVGFNLSRGDGWLLAHTQYDYPDSVGISCTPSVPASISLPGYVGSVAVGSSLRITGGGINHLRQ